MLKKKNFLRLTKTEIAAILKELGLGTLGQDELFKTYILQVVEQQQMMAEQVYNDMLRGLKIDITDVDRKAARAQVERDARTLITNLFKTEMRKVAERILEGVEKGKDPLTIARTLDMIKGLDNPRANRLETYANLINQLNLTEEEKAKKIEKYRAHLLKQRKETIARTEMAFADGQASHIEAKEEGKKWKAWMTSRDDRVSDICAGNEADGWIRIDRPFSSGHDTIPGHPNCRCTLAYRGITPGEEEISRQDQRIQQTALARKEAGK